MDKVPICEITNIFLSQTKTTKYFILLQILARFFPFLLLKLNIITHTCMYKYINCSPVLPFDLLITFLNRFLKTKIIQSFS